ncbi:MAG TPA: TonB-dependent receptor plug domain-containing protein [Opitutaceae bacterium]
MNTPTRPFLRSRLYTLTLLSLSAGSFLGAQTAGENPDDDVITLEEFQVAATADMDTYVATDAVSGTRTGAKLVETPFSVQVLTSEFINDFQLFEMADQLRFVSGAFSGAEDTGANNGKRLRGFEPPVLRDGFSRANPPDRTTVDRVEVIRGPVSTLYGQSSPGGLINYVSKRPKRVPRYSATATVGADYDFKRFAFDATGPVKQDKLYYYANYAYNYTESDLDYFYTEKDLFALGFTYLLSPKTSVTVSWERQMIESNQGDTIPLYQVSTPSPTRSVGIFWDLATYNIQGPYNKLERDFESGNILIEHRFTPNLIGRLNLQSYDKDFEEQQYRYGSGNAVTADGTMTAEAFLQNQDESAYLGQMDLLWRTQTGPVKHAFLAAADFSLYEYRNTTYVRPPEDLVLNNTTVFRRPTFVIDPWNPVWVNVPRAEITQLFQDSDRKINNYGVFVSHRAFFFNDRLVTLAGVRQDVVDSRRLLSVDATRVTSTNNHTPVVTTTDGSGSSEDALSYTFGANVKLLDERLVWFTNHSTGFEPTVTIDQGTQQVVPNEKSWGIETGLKGTMFEDALVYTVSIFKLKKTDVAISNPLYDPSAVERVSQFITSGNEEAKGYEADLRWNVTRNLFIQGGGAFVDGEVTAPVSARDRMIKSPRYTGYAATRYVFRSGPLKGLKFGGNVTYTGDYLYNAGAVNAAGVQTRFRQIHPEVTLYGAFVGYGWRTGKKWRHSVTVNGINLTDEYYLQDTFRLARGREFRLTYTLTF